LFVLQFNIRNTISDTVLDNVSVLMSPSEESGLTEDFILPLASLTAQEPGIVYVSFTRDSPDEYATASFTNTLRFVSKEVDPETGEPQEDGYDDEYQTEDLELGAGDYITPSYATFATEWDRLRSGSTATETFALTALDSLKGKHLGSCFLRPLMLNCISAAACDSLIDILNMEPLGGTESPASSSVHTLNLSGIVCGGGGKVLARSRMTYASGQGVTMELSVRAEQEGAAQLVISAIA
jgi:coatomer protein complex subunit gamma